MSSEPHCARCNRHVNFHSRCTYCNVPICEEEFRYCVYLNQYFKLEYCSKYCFVSYCEDGLFLPIFLKTIKYVDAEKVTDVLSIRYVKDKK